MVNYQYAYLTGVLILLIFWLILFFYRKDTRKEILIISTIFGFIGLIVEPIMATDWWHPLTVTGTIPGIESFIYGFTTSGIASIIYSIIFKKRKNKLQIKKIIPIVLLLALLILFISFFLFKLSSFHSAMLSALLPLSIILIKRKNFLLNSLYSGIFLTIISIPVYLIVELIFPGWINMTWYLDKLSGITFIKIPIEDIIWIFLTGMFIGPLYEYWQEAKLINYKR